MKSQIVNNKVELSLYKSTQNIFVEADKERIIQVISNLLNNAIKFTEEEVISISTKVKENSKKEVFVTIKNTGQGIHRDILPRRFASKTFQGTELRVFISKNIVEAHGGKIWAENNSDGNGATFTFSLPTNQLAKLCHILLYFMCNVKRFRRYQTSRYESKFLELPTIGNYILPTLKDLMK